MVVDSFESLMIVAFVFVVDCHCCSCHVHSSTFVPAALPRLVVAGLVVVDVWQPFSPGRFAALSVVP